MNIRTTIVYIDGMMWTILTTFVNDWKLFVVGRLQENCVSVDRHFDGFTGMNFNLFFDFIQTLQIGYLQREQKHKCVN